MKKNYSPKSNNSLFFVGCTISLIFVITPLLMKIFPCVRVVISWWLTPLESSEYKATYIESIGAIFGTFLAITGAIWTQRKIDIVNERKERKVAATIINYDFEFALNDFQRILKRYNDKTPVTGNALHNDACVKCFTEVTKRYRIYIDDNWITNVAKLTDCLFDYEIKEIYNLYGVITTIGATLNSNTNSNFDYDTAYKLIHDMYILSESLGGHRRTECELKPAISTLLARVREIAEIKHKK